MLVWRICKKQYSDSAFSGEGGLRSDGRWHYKGNRIVYTSQSLSLATLEAWMHVGPQDQMRSYVAVPAEIPGELPIHNIHELDLPPGWKSARPAPRYLKDLGTLWLNLSSTAVARVPAATTPGEFNYLLNPLHPDFIKIRQLEPQPFLFDARMWKRDQSPTR